MSEIPLLRIALSDSVNPFEVSGSITTDRPLAVGRKSLRDRRSSGSAAEQQAEFADLDLVTVSEHG